GLTGAGFCLIADGDTLLRQAVGPRPSPYRVNLARAAKRVALSAWAAPGVRQDTAVYVSSFAVHGVNVNLLQDSSAFTDRGLPVRAAWPTYAQWARAALVRQGVPAASITAVPAYGEPRSRSWANAHAFAQ